MLWDMDEQSLLMEFLGNSPMIRIWDYILTFGSLGISKTDIANNADVGRATVYRVWETLIKKNYLTYKRTAGRAELFTLNKNEPRIKKLLELQKLLATEDLQNMLKEQKKKE